LLRREGLDLVEQAKPMEAVARLQNVRHYCVNSLEMGIIFTHISGLMNTMAALKVWCEAFVAIADEDFVAVFKRKGLW